MRTIAVIQCNHVDWEGTTDVSLRKDLDGCLVIDQVVQRAKRLTRIDDLPVIACPQIPENKIFTQVAQQNGCYCFMGSTTNVLGRLYQACRSRNGDRIAWLQGIHYFLDTTLMDRLIDWSEAEGFDYARCEDGSCKQILGQIVTTDAIDRACSLIMNLPPSQQLFFSARPFAFMRAHPERFRIGLFATLPNYETETLLDIRKAAKHIYVEERAFHTKHACAVGDVSVGRYKEILHLLRPEMRVLDIACGTGYGSDLLSRKATTVVGVDISRETIELAASRYEQRIDFRVGSADAIPVEDGSIDTAVSISTIEHVENDKKFIAELARVLRPEGQLILYTPQNRMGQIPIWPWHVREYSAPWLKMVVQSHFEIDKVMGWQNGLITADDERGDGMFLIASKWAR